MIKVESDGSHFSIFDVATLSFSFIQNVGGKFSKYIMFFIVSED